MSSYEHNYRAYSPNPSASPGPGAFSSDRHDERRGVSQPDAYPPYASHNSGIEYGNMPVLDDHGDSVRLGMNTRNSNPPPPAYNSNHAYSGSSYGTPIASPPYGAPVTSYDPLHRVVSSPASSHPAAATHRELYPEAYTTSSRASQSQRSLAGAFPDDSPPRSRPRRSRRDSSSSDSSRGSPSPSVSPIRARDRARSGQKAPAGPTRNFSDLIPAGLNQANAAAAMSAVSSFFGNNAKPAAPAPSESRKVSGSGLGNFNVQNVFDYLSSTRSPSAPGSSHNGPSINLGGVSVDKEWIMNWASQQNPLVLLGIVVVAFLIISQIIATIIKWAVIGLIVYAIYLYVMNQQGGNGAASGISAIGGGRAGKSDVRRTDGGGGRRPRW